MLTSAVVFSFTVCGVGESDGVCGAEVQVEGASCGDQGRVVCGRGRVGRVNGGGSPYEGGERREGALHRLG